jgi:hypothetical protein
MGNNSLIVFLCSRTVFPRMRDSGGGSIINFARAGLPRANMVAYNCEGRCRGPYAHLGVGRKRCNHSG